MKLSGCFTKETITSLNLLCSDGNLALFIKLKKGQYVIFARETVFGVVGSYYGWI